MESHTQGHCKTCMEDVIFDEIVFMQPGFSKNAITVLEDRYLLKDDQGVPVETPDELLRRVAKHIASAEMNFGPNHEPGKWEERFYEMMRDFLFLPNSPVLMNAGTSEGQMCACFVLPVDNNWEHIYRTLYHTALIHKSGGGTGFNFSAVYSHDEANKNPLDVMQLFNQLTENIKQAGRRRGANMGILNDNHPLIMDFVSCKDDDVSFRNFNISIGVSDEFMTAVMNNNGWELREPHSGKVVKKVKARDLWDKIVDGAWRTGDPGLIFLDAINKRNPVPGMGRIVTTNPCGEVPLHPYEPCVLGSINLSRLMKEVHGRMLPDYNLIAETVDTAVRFLDNVIEVNDFLIPEIHNTARGNRKIGLGVMGWAEMLVKMEVPYSSERAFKLAEEVMSFIRAEADAASARLAGERGNFPNYDKSIFHKQGVPRRNATVLSIAPTGTISIIGGTSASIEPLYALSITRQNILSGKKIIDINPVVIELLKRKNVFTDGILSSIKRDGTLENYEKLEKRLRSVLATALEINYDCHIAHQAVFQKYTDNAVSKTINLHNDATVKDIEKAYFIAWERNCKGITVYRDGSKSMQVLYKGTEILEVNACEVCVE
jgi:ribonucleoside-diphosphate reductase alpha chain